MSEMGRIVAILLFLTALPCPIWACSLCVIGNARKTYREELKEAKFVLVGTVSNPRLTNPDLGQGKSDFHIDRVIKHHPILGNKMNLVLNRYVPVLNPKAPPKFLIFFDIFKGQLDPYMGVPFKNPDMPEYIDGCKKRIGMKRVQALPWYFKYLNHPDENISQDAFLEFARADDKEVAQVAKILPRKKLRALLLNEKTPQAQLSLLAFLLGAAGDPKDAALFSSLLSKPSKIRSKGLDGLLSGYIQLEPEPGWDKVISILKEKDRKFVDRFAATRVLRFYHNLEPVKFRGPILQATKIILTKSDMADFAINDLRQWEEWSLTPLVLQLYRKKSYSVPIIKRAILRYALVCPRKEAKQFIEAIRYMDRELVEEVEETLELERKISGKK